MKPDKYYADVFKVTSMTISRWRRGIGAIPYCVRYSAMCMQEKGQLEVVPDWLAGNATQNAD